MIIYPETLADRGCWISGNRVYAFISSEANGIAEIGYHGAQPTSRNARVFASSSGVIRFALLGSDGIVHLLVLNDYDWSPGSLKIRGSCPIATANFEIKARGREVAIFANDIVGEAATFAVQFNRSSLFSDVHGLRSWSTQPGESGWMTFHLRDRILLDDWMKRGGPYGGDFLIPEPLRRKIFRRRVRSGLATSGDLHPEFQDKPLPIYDGGVDICSGGDEYSLIETGADFLFSTPIVPPAMSLPAFRVQFDASPTIRVKERRDEVVAGGGYAAWPSAPRVIPSITLGRFPHIEQFFTAVPGLVDSCVIHEHGIARAAAGGYYWLWAWDAIVTALASLRWGAIGLAESTVAFIAGNRDEGSIPMRWTHSLEPLDTQPRGALECLLSSLIYGINRERPGTRVSRDHYALMVKHLEEMEKECDRRGLFSNMGFYPDLPVRFGRTEGSSVAMEVGAFYAFCRVCENCSVQMEDQQTAGRARRMMAALERCFCEVFWDKKHRFLIDSVERSAGLRNESYPLFSLLFLHYPPAIRLIQGYVKQSGDFISRHLLSSLGMRLLPGWDRNSGSEAVSGSWYPHWDSYAMRVLRRAGYAAEIMTWLGSVEKTLKRLGYAPEFLVLDRSLMTDPSAWLRHGSASNLNCVTGWYQGLLEAVLGLVFDPGGLTVAPLALPLEETAVDGMHHLGTRWNVKAKHKGPWLQEIRIDGNPLRGCLKIPKPYCDGAHHEVELSYGTVEQESHFVELANAEVVEVNSEAGSVEVEVNALGQVDVGFSAPASWGLYVDGKQVNAAHPDLDAGWVASLEMAGHHIVRISARS